MFCIMVDIGLKFHCWPYPPCSVTLRSNFSIQVYRAIYYPDPLMYFICVRQYSKTCVKQPIKNSQFECKDLNHK